MSLITSCPACGTMFRVVPDQLKISEGWVRCGHCAEVFDATANLVDAPELEAPPAVPTQPADLPTRPADLPTRPADLPTRPADLPTRPAEWATRPAELPTRPTELATAPAALAARPEPVRTPPAPEPGAATAGESSSFFGYDSQSLEPTPLDNPFVFRRSDLVEPGPEPSVFPLPARESQLPPDADEDEDDEEPPPLADVSFVRQARRKAFWRRPFVRVLLALVALALAALLALQYAWQERDQLALSQPTLRPALERMCEALQCTLGPPRQIEAVSIESSGFNRVRDDTYRLAFTLRNAARVPVAVPAMELTITDAQDQPVARRVITPAELGARGGSIAAGGEWSVATGIAVDAGSGTRVAGYRLLAFYP
jgi:predicted Zn finger-like uncharacterized protein